MNKGPDAYRTIGEASKEVGVEPYVLRFWEAVNVAMHQWAISLLRVSKRLHPMAKLKRAN